MDKEIDKERLKKLPPSPLRLSKQTIPNGTVYYRGNMKALKTMDIQELSAVSPKDEASFVKILLPMHTTSQGANLEIACPRRKCYLSFGQLSIRIKGLFELAGDSFDPERNTFYIVFTLSASTQLE